jgi:hypothetical protein
MKLAPLFLGALLTPLLALRPAAAQTRPAAAQAAAGPAAPVFASPAGVYAVVSSAGLSPARPGPGGLTAVRVLRAPAGRADFKEVAVVRQAASLAEFRQLAGAGALAEIKEANQLATDEAAWAYIQAHPQLDDYGLLALDMSFRVALGTAALDADAAKAPAGTRYTYRLVPEYAAGQQPPGAQNAAYPESTVTVGQRSPLPRPRARRSSGQDSAVVVRWAAPAGTALTTLFGRVWRQGPGERGFSLVAERVLASRATQGRADSVYFTFPQRVRPEALYRYYLEPLDFVGNPGPASDTVNVLSVAPARVPTVRRVTARDTTLGIVLRWPALPPKAYLLGIEVQRSRDTRGNYVRLDTLPASASSYLDTRLLPDVTYHYRLRVLLRGGLRAPEAATGAAFAAHQGGAGRSAALLAPVQLTAEPEGRGVRLRWLPAAPDANLDAYFVYRGTSAQDSLLVVSPPLRGGLLTFLDTTARNGRRQYVYAVQAVDRNLRRSPLSELAVGQPQRPMPLAAPLGLSGYLNGRAAVLSWDDAQRRDPAVVGYRLYRRPASTAAPARSSFTRVGPELRTLAYTDEALPAGAYQYAVAAVDAQGHESALTAPVTLRPAAAALAPPTQLLARALPAGLELSWSRPVAPPRGYALYRRLREQPTAQRVATLAPGQTRYLDQTAKPGTLYIYSLSALAPAAESARTAEVSARR